MTSDPTRQAFQSPGRSRSRAPRRAVARLAGLALASLTLASVPLGGVALAGLTLALPSAARAQDAASTLRPVKLMRLGERAEGVERIFYGRVTARATVDLAFQSGGRILRLPVEEGQRQPEGALLGQLDLAPFERAERRARAELNRVKDDLERMTSLGRDVVPQTRIDETRTQLELAQVQYEQAIHDLEHATLSAPFDLLVARRLAEVYATVSAGQPVVRVHDMSELRVKIDVPEILFRRFGKDLDVTAEARIAGEDRTWPLELRELTAETAARGQTYAVAFAFDNPPPENLLPGASVSVIARVAARDLDAVPRIPAEALRHAGPNSPRILVFEPDEGDPDRGVVREVPVTLSVSADGTLHLQEGPSIGTEIVAAGAADLKDGARVRRWTGLKPGRGAE